MQLAILGVASLSLVCSAGTLAIMLKVAKELKDTKTTVEFEIDTIKNKVARNQQVVKDAFGKLEF